MDVAARFRTAVFGKSTDLPAGTTPSTFIFDLLFSNYFFNFLLLLVIFSFLAALFIFFTRDQTLPRTWIIYSYFLLIVISAVAYRIIIQIEDYDDVDENDAMSKKVKSSVKSTAVSLLSGLLAPSSSLFLTNENALGEQHVSFSRAKSTVLELVMSKKAKLKEIEDNEQENSKRDESLPVKKEPEKETVKKKNKIRFCDDQSENKYISCIKRQIQEISYETEAAELVQMEIERRSKETGKKIEKFGKNFRKFQKETMTISKEMASFNAAPEHMSEVVSELVSDIKAVLNINKISEHQKKRRGMLGTASSKRWIGKQAETSKNEVIKTLKSLRLLTFLEFFLIFQIILGCLCVVSLLCVPSILRFLRLSLLFCLLICTGIAFYFMILAHISERHCLVGDLPGCPVAHDKGSHYPQLITAMKGMLSETESVLGIIRQYFESRREKQAVVKINVIREFFKRIYFVRTGFKELTKSKINSTDFFIRVGTLDKAAEELQRDLELLDKAKLMDLYTRELLSSLFLEREVARMPKRVEEIRAGGRATDDSSDCAAARKTVCDLTKHSERLFLLLTMGVCAVTLLILL